MQGPLTNEQVAHDILRVLKEFNTKANDLVQYGVLFNNIEKYTLSTVSDIKRGALFLSSKGFLILQPDSSFVLTIDGYKELDRLLLYLLCVYIKLTLVDNTTKQHLVSV